MSKIGGDYSDFDRGDPAEIDARVRQRQAANLVLRQEVCRLAQKYSYCADLRDKVGMRAAIHAIAILAKQPAHAPLLLQLCAIVSHELEAGMSAERASQLAKLLAAEAARLREGQRFASRELVAEAQAFRDRHPASIQMEPTAHRSLSRAN